MVSTAASGRAAKHRRSGEPDDEVLHAEVMESSGDVQMDRFASGLAREMRFLPASVDGVTMDVWVVVLIRVLAPRGVAYPARRPRP